MSKFNEVFEFEGQKYVKSERASSEAKVGDIVRIREDSPASNHWVSASKRLLGTVQKVIELHGIGRVEFDCTSGLWPKDYFEILEPAPKTNPRPHAELIKQWADDDSLEVQFKGHNSGEWLDSPLPSWSKDYDYRFKPKTVPAWKVLYEYGGGDIDLTAGHYRNEEEFNKLVACNEKFIKFVLETEKQIPA